MPVPFDQLELAFVAGPTDLCEPFSSIELRDAVDYTPATVADVFLSIEGTQLTHAPKPSWWEWRARWEGNGGSLELDMTLYEVEPPLWGGSPIRQSCAASDLYSYWTAVRKICPAVYLHDTDCTIYPPDYFAQLYVSS